MKITGVHIYGYGKFTDFIISDIQSLQVIYGENEAGKSTIMSFIHSILFGFPTKLQSELRYEPKEGAKYGGRLTAIFPKKGKVVIERVKGKAAGDVSVLLDDGTRGGEELLSELLQHVDKPLYQSIFSFNIHGLQNVNQMKGEDLGRYLFSAGALGTDQLVAAESSLQKELESRFKPNGKKPSLNVKLKELKQLHQDLTKAEQHNEQYWTLIQKKETLEKGLTEQQDEQLRIQQQLSRLKEWMNLMPLLKEDNELKREFEQFDESSFPADGLAALEKLEGMIQPIEGRKASLAARIAILEKELEGNKPDRSLLEKETQILSAAEGLPLLGKLQQEEHELGLKLAHISQEISILQEKLHLQLEDSRLDLIDTSVFAKEKINKAQMRQNRLHAKKQELDERFNDEKSALEKIETKICAVKEQLLSEPERAALKEKVKLSADRRLLEKELQNIQERLLFLERAKEKERKNSSEKRKQEQSQLLIFGILFAALLAWGMWSEVWLLAITGFMGIAFCAFMFYKKQPFQADNLLKDEMLTLSEKEQALMETLKQPNIQDAAKWEAQLQRDSEIQSQLRHYTFQLEQANERYEKVIADFESWEMEYAELDKVMTELGRLLYLPDDIVRFHLQEAFGLIEQLKALNREKKYVLERQTAVSKGIREKLSIFATLEELAEERQESVQALAYHLKKRLKEETEKQIKLDERKAKLNELKDEFGTVLAELGHFQNELEQLLALAGAKTTEEYRKKSIAARKKDELNERIKQLRKQINMHSFSHDEIKEYLKINNPEMDIIALNKELKKLGDSIPSLQSKLAEVKYEIQLLEDGGTYSELFHKFSLLKAEFEEDAREWAKYAAAKDIFERTINSYKNERLPKMLEKAEEFLSYLTNGNYIRIYPKIEGTGFLIGSRNGTVYEAKELSQATAEQIYVSFRLALAVTVYGKYPFPIMIDDSFVNFDHVRTEKMISLLKNLSDRQILFFTCHKHLLPYFQEEQIRSVKNEKLPVRI